MEKQMKRRIMDPKEVNQMSEVVIGMLRGLPVAHALAVLDTTRSNLLWLATVSKPEELQTDLEDFLTR
jgi:hypothetical protein